MKAPVLFLLVALACTGCSRSDPEQAAASAEKPAANAAAKPQTQSDPLAAMAHAVALSRSNSGIELSYDIAAKPVLGRPVEVKLMFVPTADAQSLTVDVSAAQPLQLGGQLKANFTDVKLGHINPQSFTVSLPSEAREGIYIANVAVSLTRGATTASKTFAIPLVFVKAEAAAAPGMAAGAGAAKG